MFITIMKNSNRPGSSDWLPNSTLFSNNKSSSELQCTVHCNCSGSADGETTSYSEAGYVIVVLGTQVKRS